MPTKKLQVVQDAERKWHSKKNAATEAAARTVVVSKEALASHEKPPVLGVPDLVVDTHHNSALHEVRHDAPNHAHVAHALDCCADHGCVSRATV